MAGKMTMLPSVVFNRGYCDRQHEWPQGADEDFEKGWALPQREIARREREVVFARRLGAHADFRTLLDWRGVLLAEDKPRFGIAFPRCEMPVAYPTDEFVLSRRYGG